MQNEVRTWIVECQQCTFRADQSAFQRPYRCGNCGSTWVLTGESFDSKIGEVVEAAAACFWECVGEKFPNISSGDFPPEADEEFATACKNAIRTWLNFNQFVETGNEENNGSKEKTE